MDYINKQSVEPLIFEAEDWSEEEWGTILKIFGMKEAERIIISGYRFEAFGEECETVTDEDWEQAIKYLDSLILLYSGIGPAGMFGLAGVLTPLKTRYENGERTLELYKEIMQCE